MPLVGYVTARFMGRGYEYEELYQYGCIGLIKAVDRFDPDYGVAFSTYAVPLIIGEIKRFIRSDGQIHVSRTIKEHAYNIRKAMDSSEKAGKSLSLDELSNEVGLDKQETVIALNSLSPVKSIYEPVGGDGELMLQDMLGIDNGQSITDMIALEQAIDKLDDGERELIYRRYYMFHTQTSIAIEKGMTQVQISRLEKKLLEKLKKMLT